MPHEGLYWNSVDFGSDEESLHYSDRRKHYVDPWDLENYAYIRGHIESSESPFGSSSSSAIHEANSTSFYYVPGQMHMKEQNYAAIEEIRPKSARTYRKHYAPPSPQLRHHFDSDLDEESPYEENLMDSSSYYVSPQTKLRRKSKSADKYPYGGYDENSEIYNRREEIYRENYNNNAPVYDDIRSYNAKPKNFSLTNYGHLKIDYSYSWNNLNKYIHN